MRRVLSLVLASILSLCMMTPAFAASDEATAAADALYELGLFGGTGIDANGDPIYDLDRMPTRHEAVTMLVSLLGKKDEALAGTWETPFTDVADWAKPFVGYAYAHGLTSGTSATLYGGNDLVTVSQYLTFVLKTLGYEVGKDFQWDRAWELSDAIGLTDGEYHAETTTFTRGDVAMISLRTHEIQQVLSDATVWGVPSDIQWIAELKTVEDLDNNILYSFLFGNYSLHFSNVTTTAEVDVKTISNLMRTRIKSLSHTYPELVGIFSNVFVGCGASPEGVFIDFPKASLDIEEIYDQQIIVLNTAREMRHALYAEGVLVDGMSQKEIARVYYDYLRGLGVAVGGGPEEVKQGKSVEYDSPYACLVNRKADCVGRAGAFNLFMHLEGISAQGVAGQIKGTNSGHVLNRVVLDGETYYCDWGNGRPLAKNIDSWFEFEDAN